MNSHRWARMGRRRVKVRNIFTFKHTSMLSGRDANHLIQDKGIRDIETAFIILFQSLVVNGGFLRPLRGSKRAKKKKRGQCSGLRNAPKESRRPYTNTHKLGQEENIRAWPRLALKPKRSVKADTQTQDDLHCRD